MKTAALAIKKRLLQSKLVQDSFWSLMGNVVGRGLALLAGILVARFLGKDVFGEYGIIRNTILTIGIFSTFGLGNTATKYIAEFRTTNREKIPLFIKNANKITFVFSGFMALLLFGFADFIALQWLEASHLGTALRILSVLIIFNAITTTQIGILSGFGRFKEIAKVNSVVGVLTFVSSVGLTYYFNLNGALLALLLVQIINCVLNYYLVRRETATIRSSIEDKIMLKSILSFSTPIALQEAIYSITSWLASLLLIQYSTFGDLGMYTAAMQWNALILFIPGILRNVVLSHLSENNKSKDNHGRILKRIITINFIATIIPCFFVLILSGFIESSYGETFNGLSLIISIAVFTTIFTSISNVYAQAFTSLNKNWLMLVFRSIRDLSILIGFLILINLSTLNGVISMVTSNLVLSFVFVLIISLKYNQLKKKANPDVSIH